MDFFVFLWRRTSYGPLFFPSKFSSEYPGFPYFFCDFSKYPPLDGWKINPLGCGQTPKWEIFVPFNLKENSYDLPPVKQSPRPAYIRSRLYSYGKHVIGIIPCDFYSLSSVKQFCIKGELPTLGLGYVHMENMENMRSVLFHVLSPIFQNNSTQFLVWHFCERRKICRSSTCNLCFGCAKEESTLHIFLLKLLIWVLDKLKWVLTEGVWIVWPICHSCNLVNSVYGWAYSYCVT